MATTAEPGASLIGASVRRKEDPRFITGKGRYTDDITLPGQTYAAFVRSPHANATINSIDARAALALPGVHSVLTGEDMKAAGVNPIPPGWLHPGIKIAEFRALAVGRVSHVGNAVAVVIADSPRIARDAADLVNVDYTDHPAVADAVAALKPGAPQVHPDVPGNVVFTWQLGDAAAADAGIAGATTVVRQHLVNQRLIANAIEPRASLANYDAADRRAHPLRHVAEPARAPPDHGGVRAGAPGAQVPRHLARCGRRLRLEDLHLSRGMRRRLGVARRSGAR